MASNFFWWLMINLTPEIHITHTLDTKMIQHQNIERRGNNFIGLIYLLKIFFSELIVV